MIRFLAALRRVFRHAPAAFITGDATGAVFINCRTSAEDPRWFILEDW